MRKAGANGIALVVAAWHTGTGSSRLEWNSAEKDEAIAAILLIRSANLRAVVVPALLYGDSVDRVSQPASIEAASEWLSAFADAAEVAGAHALIFPSEAAASYRDGDIRVALASLRRRFSGTLCLNLEGNSATPYRDVSEHIDLVTLSLHSGVNGEKERRVLENAAAGAHRRLVLVAGIPSVRLHASLTAYNAAPPARDGLPEQNELALVERMLQSRSFHSLIVDARAISDPRLGKEVAKLFDTLRDLRNKEAFHPRAEIRESK